jgi:hypothetical protein
MSDVAMPATQAPASAERREAGSWLVRWAPLGGLVWFVAYPAGFLFGTGGGDTPAEVVDRAESHEVGIGIVQMVALLSRCSSVGSSAACTHACKRSVASRACLL